MFEIQLEHELRGCCTLQSHVLYVLFVNSSIVTSDLSLLSTAFVLHRLAPQ